MLDGLMNGILLHVINDEVRKNITDISEFNATKQDIVYSESNFFDGMKTKILFTTISSPLNEQRSVEKFIFYNGIVSSTNNKKVSINVYN